MSNINNHVYRWNTHFLTNCTARLPTKPEEIANKQYVDSISAFGNTTDVWNGGSLSHMFIALGVTTSSAVTANILSSENIVAIARVIPGNNSFIVTFTADPGPGTVINWISVEKIQRCEEVKETKNF